MRTRKCRHYCCDFETTVFPGQEYTEVWAAACVEMYTEDVRIFHSIDEQFEFFCDTRQNLICYYHNLKFDGAFWLSYLLTDLGHKQAAVRRTTGEDDFYEDGEADDFAWVDPWKMKAKTVQYVISDMGQWYKIVVKYDKYHIIEFRDSLKLLPFSLATIGKSFKTKHQKLEMTYEGIRYAGCEITPEETDYIRNDVLVLKEALEIMYNQGSSRLTIGSCCLAEFRATMSNTEYQEYFPNLYEYPLDKKIFGAKNIGAYIRKSYRGGWCYLAKGKEGKIYTGGTTADVNSLYPSMMHSESGNFFPVGVPTFWQGDYIPNEALQPDKYYFVRIRTRFYLKPGKLPFIQLKSNMMYRPNECLETSDIEDNGEHYECYEDFDGKIKPATVEMTLTCTDFRLILEHYDLREAEIIDGCYFDATIGIFDAYIDKYRKIKTESRGAVRQWAKLMLNNLYGKMATSPDNDFKVAWIRPDKTIAFYTVDAARPIEGAVLPPKGKIPGYIPVGSAITSYARNFTIRAAQANYHGPDKPGFIYADTDSIHCDLPPDEINGINVDPVRFCCWKLESCWDQGYYVRQKTYAEHITHEDLEPVPEPYYDIKCAGMPERSKNLFLLSMGELAEVKDITFDEIKFCETERSLEDFKRGLTVPGKLLPKRIRGGVILVNTKYQMR